MGGPTVVAHPRGRTRLLRRYIAPQWPWFLVILSLTVASSALAALQPWPMKLLVDHGLQAEPLPARLSAWLAGAGISTTPNALVASAAALSLAVFALSSLAGAALSWCWAVAGQRMVTSLTADLFAQMQRLSLLFHYRRAVGDSLSRITTDTWAVYGLTSSLLVSPFQQALTLVTMGWVAWTLNSDLALMTLALAPLLAVSSLGFGRMLKRRAAGGREAQSRLMSFVQQTLAAIPIVQAFGREPLNTQRFGALAEDAVVWAQRTAVATRTFGLVNGLITTSGMAIVLFAGSRRVLDGQMTLGALVVFLSYIRSLQEAAQGLLQTYSALKPVEASLERVTEILDHEEVVRDGPHVRRLDAGWRPRGEVRFEAVGFDYLPGTPVLRDVTLDVHPGESMAIVGATGAGKTTLVSLIPRFFDPSTGRITLDGIDLRELPLARLRAHVAFVMQEPFLLPLTIAENIAYGRPDAPRHEIEAAAAAANAAEFIERLPAGYDTPIGERGSTLSGGEKQRLSIARALLKDAPILILDEPTAALDARTEAAVVQGIERLMAGRTTFVIAHRLSTIRRATRIAALDLGRIVEVGPHRELLARGGAYAALYAQQFAGGREAV